MKCKEYHKLISTEIDDEISEDERESLKRHLDQCPECRQFKAFLLSVSGVHVGIKMPNLHLQFLTELCPGFMRKMMSGKLPAG